MIETGVELFYCNKKTTCCFTGHRSRDLPFRGDIKKRGMRCLKSMLDYFIEEAYADGYRTFISGMADGIDLICAEIVYGMRESGQFPGINLVCAVPYIEQEEEISQPFSRHIYNEIIDGCDERDMVGVKSDKERYRLRNQFMVDRSSRIIGAYRFKKRGSGTLQTINMAKRGGLELKIIDMDKNPVIYSDDENPVNLNLFDIVTV